MGGCGGAAVLALELAHAAIACAGCRLQPGGVFDLQPLSFSNELIFSNRLGSVWMKPQKGAEVALKGHSFGSRCSRSLLQPAIVAPHNANCPAHRPFLGWWETVQWALGVGRWALGVDIDANCRGSSAVER